MPAIDERTGDRALAGATEGVAADRVAATVYARRTEGARIEGEVLDADVVAVARQLVAEIVRRLHFGGRPGDAGPMSTESFADVIEGVCGVGRGGCERVACGGRDRGLRRRDLYAR